MYLARKGGEGGGVAGRLTWSVCRPVARIHIEVPCWRNSKSGLPSQPRLASTTHCISASLVLSVRRAFTTWSTSAKPSAKSWPWPSGRPLCRKIELKARDSFVIRSVMPGELDRVRVWRPRPDGGGHRVSWSPVALRTRSGEWLAGCPFL